MAHIYGPLILDVKFCLIFNDTSIEGWYSQLIIFSFELIIDLWEAELLGVIEILHFYDSSKFLALIWGTLPIFKK